ncbi:MAG: hypothetical protein SD837_21230 [Candidatus Electrothrix scaldis]|nr:MAG: hypothetical protein SD837_21230 [Candidatus Electrothrix sp. GW3-3]
MLNTSGACFNHANREPVARCPECNRYFCRECVSDHDGRLLCSACLHNTTEHQEERKSSWLKYLIPPFQVLLGVLGAWLAFYLLASTLLSIPSTIHDVTFRHEQKAR